METQVMTVGHIRIAIAILSPPVDSAIIFDPKKGADGEVYVAGPPPRLLHYVKLLELKRAGWYWDGEAEFWRHAYGG